MIIMHHTINEHRYWYYLNLNEKLHYFEGNKNSKYRTVINGIINRILYDVPDDNVLLYINSHITYHYYEFLMPFALINRFNIIDKLKVYIHFINPNNIGVENEEFYILADEKNFDESDYNQKCLPLFLANGSHINVMSIVISIVNDKDCLLIMQKTIPHELRHALDYIGNKKLADITNKNARDSKKFQEIKTYNSLEHLLLLLADNCSYYCLDTEIDAHIETALVEAEISQLTRDDFLQILRDYSNYDTLPDNIQNALVTFYNYKVLLNMVNTYLQYTNMQFMKMKYFTDRIMNIVYNNPQLRTFKDLLIYWQKLLEKFFHRLGQIVYDQYDI